MSTSSMLVRNLLSVTGLSLSANFLTLISVVLIARSMDIADYGVLGICLGVLNLYVIAFSSGSSAFLAREYTRFARHSLFGAYFLNTMMSMLALLSVAFLVYKTLTIVDSSLGAIYQANVFYIVVGASILSAKNHLQRILLARYQSTSSCALDIIDPIAKISMVLWLVSYEPLSVADILFAYVFGTFISCLVGLSLLVRWHALRVHEFPFEKGGMKSRWVGAHYWRFARRFALMGIASWLVSVSPRFIIGGSGNVEGAGAFFFAAQLCYLPFIFIATALMKVLGPRIYNSKDDLNDVLISSGLVKFIFKFEILVALILIPVIYLCSPMIWEMGGYQENDYYSILLLLLGTAGVFAGANQYLLTLAIRSDSYMSYVSLQLLLVTTLLPAGIYVRQDFSVIYCAVVVFIISILSNFFLIFRIGGDKEKVLNL